MTKHNVYHEKNTFSYLDFSLIPLTASRAFPHVCSNFPHTCLSSQNPLESILVPMVLHHFWCLPTASLPCPVPPLSLPVFLQNVSTTGENRLLSPTFFHTHHGVRTTPCPEKGLALAPGFGRSSVVDLIGDCAYRM